MAVVDDATAAADNTATTTTDIRARTSRSTSLRGNHAVLGMLSLVVLLLCWSFGPALTRRVTLHPITAAFVRMTAAAAVQWLVCAILRITPSLALLKRSLLPGAFMCVNNLFFWFAIQRISVASATLLASLQPIVVLFVAPRLFDEDVTPWDVMWTIVAMAGASFAVAIGGATGSERSSVDPVGVLFGLGSMLFFAAYFVIGKLQNAPRNGHGTTIDGQAAKPPNPFTYMTAILSGAAITSIPFLLLSGHTGDVANFPVSQIIPISLVIIVPTAGHVFLSFSHRYIDASISSLVLLVQPITAALVAWWLVDQPVKLLQALGAVVVVVAIAAVTIRKRAVSAAVGAAAEQ